MNRPPNAICRKFWRKRRKLICKLLRKVTSRVEHSFSRIMFCLRNLLGKLNVVHCMEKKNSAPFWLKIHDGDEKRFVLFSHNFPGWKKRKQNRLQKSRWLREIHKHLDSHNKFMFCEKDFFDFLGQRTHFKTEGSRTVLESSQKESLETLRVKIDFQFSENKQRNFELESKSNSEFLVFGLMLKKCRLGSNFFSKNQTTSLIFVDNWI